MVVLGIPYDSNQTYITGSRFAPTYIRIASESIEEYSMLQGIDIRNLDISDWGDVEVSFGNFEETSERVEHALKELSFAEKYLFIGGDHTITLFTINFFRGEVRKYVHLDAHGDFEDTYLGSRYTHDSVLRRIGEILGWENICLLGVRSLSQKAHRELENLGIEYYTSLEIKENPEILRDNLRNADYISIDIDVIDPAYAPEVANPEPLGLAPVEIINGLLETKPKFVDVVEAVPRDHTSITAILAATLIREILIILSKT